eukprot:CAMPEP_0185364534 /NCGR_PEP_ID=MMETSP1364-20130426/12444_1 /TAXON_ID=38817 /ORGANISM="Gephyrocapsa oceanica, Strain RCC1303" /LENGTH=129 /DNA_ID=CAMNT_0027965031 /DNA_START=86 /DNA_END=476 /DNA_ORIENTATION=-
MEGVANRGGRAAAGHFVRSSSSFSFLTCSRYGPRYDSNGSSFSATSGGNVLIDSRAPSHASAAAPSHSARQAAAASARASPPPSRSGSPRTAARDLTAPSQPWPGRPCWRGSTATRASPAGDQLQQPVI